MSEDPTIKDVIDTIQTFAGSVDRRFEQIDDRFDRIDGRFEQIDDRFDRIDGRFERVDTRFEHIESTMATKEDLAKLESKMVNEIDRFVVLHQTLDIELASLRSRCGRMEDFMVRIGDKLDMKYSPT